MSQMLLFKNMMRAAMALETQKYLVTVERLRADGSPFKHLDNLDVFGIFLHYWHHHHSYFNTYLGHITQLFAAL